MDIGHIIKRSWKITWQYRALWVFGILAGCGSSQSSGSGGSGTSWQTNANFSSPDMVRYDRMFAQIGAWLKTHIALILGVLIALFILRLLFGLLALWSEGALIAGVDKADRDESESVTFSALAAAGWQIFGRMFALALLSFFLVVAILLIFFGPAALALALGAGKDRLGLMLGGVGLFLVAFLIVLALVLIWDAVYVLARRALVLDELSVWDAVQRGWQVFKRNLGEIVVMGLIIFLLRLAFGFLMIIPALPFVLVLMRWFFASHAVNWPVMIGLMVLVYLPLAIGLGGIFYTFISGIWTLTYRALTRPAAADAAAEASNPGGDSLVDAPTD